jgi:hypothetical protein
LKLRHRLVTAIISTLIIITTGYFYPKQDRSRLTSLSDLANAVLSELPDGAVLFTDDYSLFQAASWLKITTASQRKITLVSQYHLALPWYDSQLSRTLPVPPTAFSLAEQLWRNPVHLRDVRFGEIARDHAEQIMSVLITQLLPARVFYFPQNFTTLLENWHQFRLKL